MARQAALEAVLARADRADGLPRLGGMARPHGVVIVSERFWAFATLSGELHEGTMTRHGSAAARAPLVRGLLQLASSVKPLLRGAGVARRRERLFLLLALVAPFFLLALPNRYEPAAAIALTLLLVCWLMRGRTLRLHGAEHRAIAAVESRALGATWSGHARPTRISPRCGTNLVALALPITAVLDRMIPLGAAPAVASAAVAVLSLAVTMELWKAVQHPSGLLKPLLLPGMALQHLTTREPELADTQVALTAVASVLRRELELPAAP